MKTPKKSATVSVKASQQQILDAQKWNEFVTHCQVRWECLSPAWQEFYYLMGDVGSSSEQLNESIQDAINKDKEIK